MEIETTRFGRIRVEEERIISFPRGLLGFPDHQRYALIQTGAENYFFWLQCVEEPGLAFVVTNPGIFFKDYQAALKPETLAELAIEEPTGMQVFVICNKVNTWLTGNMLGPLVINPLTQQGLQIVLTEKKWNTRQPLMQLQPEVLLAKSA